MDALATADRRIVAVGDHLALLLVLGWGYTHHYGPEGLFDVAGLARSVGPFLVGYLLAALLVGAYESASLREPVRGMRTATAAWLGATGLGLVARTSAYVPGGAAWPFALVVLGTGALALLGWRALALIVLEQPEPAGA